MTRSCVELLRRRLRGDGSELDRREPAPLTATRPSSEECSKQRNGVTRQLTKVVSLTSCLAFTTLPELALDDRGAAPMFVFVLMFRVAIGRFCASHKRIVS